MDLVALMKVNSYEDNLKNNIIDLVKYIGGFESIVKRGDKVLIKPNFVAPNPVETATNTHPQFIKAVVEILKEHGCSVSIGDSPMIGNCTEVAHKLGLDESLKKYNVNFIDFKKPKDVYFDDNYFDNIKFRGLALAEEISYFDKIINLPKLKTHLQTGVTLATKNMFGCVVKREKLAWHYITSNKRRFCRLLVEISQAVSPAVNIMDGIAGMDKAGPIDGRSVNTNVILASKNCIALDRVVIELIGRNPRQFPIFKAAHDMSISGTDMLNILVKGSKIEECRIKNFKVPFTLPVDFIIFYLMGIPFKKLITGKY